MSVGTTRDTAAHRHLTHAKLKKSETHTNVTNRQGRARLQTATNATKREQPKKALVAQKYKKVPVTQTNHMHNKTDEPRKREKAYPGQQRQRNQCGITQME